MGYLANFIVYTLAMVGVMGLALFAFKKFAIGGVKSGNGKSLKVLDSMTLAPRKTLYIVSAGDEKFLIAGDVDRTTLISKLGEQKAVQTQSPLPDFKATM
ncbi:MAG: flagellar biosynthetic protein FliO, partial [Candidatus Gastranaerophilales bacterium]|nr:flagellar biosynthetic protein FliO [Candidatus Gastranaerophilales bacterium]